MRRNSLGMRGRFVGCMIFFIIFILVLVPFMGVTCNAVSGDNVVAEKYAPALYFEKDEKCYPVDAMYHIDNSYLYKVDSDEVDMDPTTSELASLTDEKAGYYLDNYDKTIDSGVSAYSTGDYAKTVYYKVHIVDSSTTVIQYWFFYSFNNGDLNKHEGDWEMVQVVLTDNEPSWVAYSQHHSGQWANWNQVEKDGDHIKLFDARGSHAIYLRSYSGKLGIASDVVGDNGIVMKPGSYTLTDLDSQQWLSFAGNWGEVGESGADAASSSILGEAGPQGPMYREEGKMWNDPLGWGKNLPQANDMLFIVEWFLYNIVIIIIVITLIILAVTFVLIYRRHKKYGLGPRKVSMLYIDGLNLKSIGNILCIVGIIIAIIGLLNTWYEVSYDFSSSGDLPALETAGWQSLLKIDGISGIQIVVPGSNGPTPVGTLSIPFSLLLGIGIIFLIIATIGIIRSTKLGFKYIWRGMRLFTPIILILIVVVLLGSLVPKDMAGDQAEGVEVDKIFGSISGAPFGGENSVDFPYTQNDPVTGGEVEKTATLNMKWGLGLGGILLLLGGIIIIVSGVFEIVAKTQFFEPKTPIGKPKKEKKSKKGKEETPKATVPPPEETKQSPPVSTGANFCPECGNKIEMGAEFCPECGAKIK